MREKGRYLAPLAGAAAGLVNGLLGAGGGMILLPLLNRSGKLSANEAFACSVCVMLPISAVSVAIYFLRGGSIPIEAPAYLFGGALGGIAAGLLLRRVRANWLHRALGALMLLGAVRLLTQ